jgi:L-xylulokinase
LGRYVIGVDSGGTYVKAGLFDEAGRRLGLVRRPSVTRKMHGGRVEIDLEALWGANSACVRDVIAESGVAPDEIACIGFAGQGKGLYMLGDGGQVIRAAITSADTRASAHVERWQADGSARSVSSRTLQGLYSSHPVSILAWLKDGEPDIYAKVRWVFSMKDYLVFRSTGRVISDFSNQSGNSLVNLESGDYDPEILRTLDIPEIISKLPPMLHATEIAGDVTARAAMDLGCAPGTKVIAGMFDVNASALAAGLVDENTLCVITGTAGVNVYASREPVRDGSVAMNSLYCIPGYYLIEEGSNSSLGCLEWVLGLLFSHEVAKAREAGDDFYLQSERIASAVSVDHSDAAFLPYLSGDGGYGPAGGVWLGMSLSDGRAHLLRTVYEGVAFAHKRHVERLLRNRSAPASIRVAGGGVHSPFFLQVLADVLQAPIELTECDELGVLGVSIAAGIAMGRYPDFVDAVNHLVPLGRTVLPNAKACDSYTRKYARFTAAADKLNGLWVDGK